MTCAGFHPAVSPLGGDRVAVIITLPDEGIRQPAAAGLAVIEQATGPVRSAEMMTTADFDRQLGLPPLSGLLSLSDLLSVSEVAEELGISRQAVLARLIAGTLSGTQVGRAWVIPRSALPQSATGQ